MARLKPGAWLAPFWGKKGYSTGRDPLGMQVASIATYAILLPGLTNLTRRVRYYSFYCWVIERYAKDESSTASDIFKRFVRRAELQFAYGMTVCFPDSPAVVGKDWAVRALRDLGDSVPDEHQVDLANGADQNAGPTYWKYSLGAFGQYFLGSLLQLGLVREREGSPGVYLCTEAGRNLAACFAVNVEAAHADAFFEAVQAGAAKVQNLRAIMPSIALDEIKVDSDEWSFIRELLVGPDDGGQNEVSSFFRKETMRSYLEYLALDPKGKEDTFSRHNFEKVLATGFALATDIQRGWFIYEVNEIGHYSMGAIFWGVLEVLREKARPVPYRVLEIELTENLLSALHAFSAGRLTGESKTSEATDIIGLSAADFSESALETGITDAISKGEAYSSMTHGLLLALKVYQRVNADIDSLSAFALEHGMAREGDISDLVAFLKHHQATNLREMVAILLRRNIVNRHIEESVRKMGGGIRNTLKFTNEGGRLFHIQTVGPQRTQPRLGSLNQFLIDLKMLSGEGRLTPYGTSILEGAL